MLTNFFANDFSNIFRKYDLKPYSQLNSFFLDIDSVKLMHVVLSFLRDHESCFFKLLTDILVVDYPERNRRFTIIYCLLSVKYNTRLYVRMQTNELIGVPSITNIYKCACWMEREVWDMNGIFFENHPDLRRLLTDYGFEGHPLRKDFPLTGYAEVRYDDSQKRVIYESVEMMQEYRVFNFENHW